MNDESKSNQTIKKYVSFGIMTSIVNYSDDEKIKKCLGQGCEYSFNFELDESSS